MIPPTNIDVMNIAELKAQLQQRSLSTTGRKAELKMRLLQDMESRKADVPSEESDDCLKVSDFELFASDYEEFKSFVIDRLSILLDYSTEQSNNDSTENEVLTLRRENAKLQEEIRSKKESDLNSQRAIEDLKHKIKFLRDELENKKVIIGILTKDNEDLRKNDWDIVDARNTNRKHIQNRQNDLLSTKNRLNDLTIVEPTTTSNRFQVLENEPSHNVWNIHEENCFIRKEKSPQNKTVRETRSYNRHIVQNPDNNVQRWKDQPKKNGSNKHKNILVIGDSIIKHISYRKLNSHVQNGKVFVKSFPGATVSQLEHYITPHLTERCPDIVGLHIGTNNIKPRYPAHEKTSLEIANHVINIARKCKEHGVKEVFISSITCRSNRHEMQKVLDTNCHLMNLCNTQKFHFISNSNIQLQNLWEDGLHLGDSGIEILENNFISSLSRNFE